MLLRRLSSDNKGNLSGLTEEGESLALFVPHPNAISSQYNTQLIDSELRDAEEKLKQRARTDIEKYYFIGGGEHRIGHFVIPYIVFYK